MRPGLASRYTVERRPDGKVLEGHWTPAAAVRSARDRARITGRMHWVRDRGRVVLLARPPVIVRRD